MLQAASSVVPFPTADWSRTELGDPAGWSHTLRLAVDFVLHTPLPMLLVWGPRRVLVYNVAYADLAGPGHPRAPGGKVPAIWPAPLGVGGAAFDAALNGEHRVLARQALALSPLPGGARAQFDLHFSPVRGPDDAVCGVLCALAPASAPPLPEAGGALRILVVEDNLDAQYLVVEMLRAFGHTAEGVAHGEDGLALLARQSFDVLFSDVSLPGISGVELARLALQSHPHLQVIFASGYGDTLLRHVQFPFQSLQKPYDLDQLQAALAGIAARTG